MDDETTKQELVILLCHYLRHRYPQMYDKVSSFFTERGLLPPGLTSMDEALDVRYRNFSENQFHEFVKLLRPDDDFPSIFRRISPFEPPPVDHHFEFVSPVMRVYSHENTIYSVTTDVLSRILVTASEDIKIWRIPDLCPICRLSGHEGIVTSLCINAKCTILLSSSCDKTIRLWSLKNGRCLSMLGGSTEPVNHAVFSPTGSVIAAGSEDGCIALWMTKDAVCGRAPMQIVRVPERKPVLWLSYSPGSEFLSYACGAPHAVVMSMKKRTRFELEGSQGQVDQVRFAKSHVCVNGTVGPRLLTVSYEDGAAGVWHVDGGVWKLVSLFKQTGQGRRSAKLYKAALDQDEQILVMAKTNGVYVCDTMNGKAIEQIHGSALAFENCTVVVGHPVRKEIFLLANVSGAICLIDTSKLCVVPGSERKFEDGRQFVDAVWSRDGEYVFITDQVGFITVFKSGDMSNRCVQLDLMTSTEKGIESEFYYCDRKGNRLEPQPVHLDLRRMNLALNMTQSPVLRDYAVELELIRELHRPDQTMVVAPEQRRIDPPPLHIRLSNEYPVNPHGRTHLNLVGDTGPAKEEEPFRIVSETDDWNLSEFDIDQVDDVQEPPGYLCSSDIPAGYWPEWVTAVSCDDSIFVPQVGEEVMFSKRGYDKMLKERGITEDLTKLAKLDENERLSICFVDTCDVGARLTVQVMKDRDKKERFDIVCRVPETVPFMVPMMKYRASTEMMQNLRDGASVTIFRPGEGGILKPCYGTVQSIRPNWTMDPFECITISWSGSEESSNVCPWELASVNGTPVPAGDISRFILVQEQVRDEVDKVITNPKFSQAVRCPDPRVIPNLPEKIHMPMSAMMIRERLDGGWYRTFLGIMGDIRLLSNNVNTLSEIGDTPQETAREVCLALKAILESWFKRLKEQRDRARQELERQKK